MPDRRVHRAVMGLIVSKNLSKKTYSLGFTKGCEENNVQQKFLYLLPVMPVNTRFNFRKS